jgi:hypothetical protein
MGKRVKLEAEALELDLGHLKETVIAREVEKEKNAGGRKKKTTPTLQITFHESAGNASEQSLENKQRKYYYLCIYN